MRFHLCCAGETAINKYQRVTALHRNRDHTHGTAMRSGMTEQHGTGILGPIPSQAIFVQMRIRGLTPWQQLKSWRRATCRQSSSHWEGNVDPTLKFRWKDVRDKKRRIKHSRSAVREAAMQHNRRAEPPRNSDDLEQSSPRSDQGKMRRAGDIPNPNQNRPLRRDARGARRGDTPRRRRVSVARPARPAGGGGEGRASPGGGNRNYVGRRARWYK